MMEEIRFAILNKLNFRGFINILKLHYVPWSEDGCLSAGGLGVEQCMDDIRCTRYYDMREEVLDIRISCGFDKLASNGWSCR